jgi:hypothetical protein
MSVINIIILLAILSIKKVLFFQKTVPLMKFFTFPQDHFSEIQEFKCNSSFHYLNPDLVYCMFLCVKLISTFNSVGQGGNDFGEEFMDYKLNNTPLVTVYVKPVVGTCDLKFEPELHHIRGSVQRCFEKIIQVNQKLPRIDCLLFPGMSMVPLE